jgi:hypothetical protein
LGALGEEHPNVVGIVAAYEKRHQDARSRQRLVLREVLAAHSDSLETIEDIARRSCCTIISRHGECDYQIESFEDIFSRVNSYLLKINLVV